MSARFNRGSSEEREKREGYLRQLQLLRRYAPHSSSEGSERQLIRDFGAECANRLLSGKKVSEEQEHDDHIESNLVDIKKRGAMMAPLKISKDYKTV